MLDTSAAIYEKDGRYALGLFASSWCQFMDQASRDLCNTADNEEALRCGKWLCHESCWQKAALKAINTGKSADVKCAGGIHLYATPIRSGGEIIGAINFGYGDPPRDQATLKKLASKFKVPLQELSERAHSYKSRPNFIIELAKQRLEVSAALIGEIVERKQIQQALQESQLEHQNISKELESILDHIPGLVFYKDKENNFIRVNKYVAAAYQKTKKELEGANTSELHSDEIAEQYLQDDLNVINSGVAKLNIEEQWVTAEGLKWLSTSKIPFVNDKGQIIGIIGVSIDITKRKQAEINLKKTQDKLMKLERKNAVLAMIVTANHEINQPLTVLRGNLELLERKLHEKKYEKYLLAMEQSLTRIDNILSKLRDLDEIKLKRYSGNTPMLDF